MKSLLRYYNNTNLFACSNFFSRQNKTMADVNIANMSVSSNEGCAECLCDERVEKILDSIFGKLSDIVKLPRTEQATYADHICALWVMQPDNAELESQVKQMLPRALGATKDDFFAQMNGTAIGNLAHIATHYKNESICEIAGQVLDEYLKWYSASH